MLQKRLTTTKTVFLMLLLLLCSCGRDEGGDPAASGVLAPFSDVRGIGETVTLQADEYVPEEISTYWFNQNTVFEGAQELAGQILESGKDPGLGVSELHAKGITGKGVTVAIIDQPLLMDHPEYAGKIEEYHTIGLKKGDDASSMHGPAVTSLLAGDTIGTAPDVKLYYVALRFWDRSAPKMAAEALDWLIEQNERLPQPDKIRAVSISADFTNQKNFADKGEWEEAVQRAEESGILVLDCRKDCDTCLFWPCSFDPEHRDEVERCVMGTPDGGFQECPSQAVGVPAGYRSVAEVYTPGEYSYSYDAIGGHSWAVPYGTGILALGWQVNPALTGQEMAGLLEKTVCQNEAGERFINPVAFIEAVEETLH